MGNCTSAEGASAQPPHPQQPPPQQPGAKQQQASQQQPQQPHQQQQQKQQQQQQQQPAPAAGPGSPLARAPSSTASGACPAGRVNSATRAELQLELLGNVHGLQQQLALVNENPLIGLQEAAEQLVATLEADLCAVWVLTRDDPGRSVLVACHGKGAPALMRQPVVRVPQAKPGGPAPAARLGAPASLYIPDAARNPEDAIALPRELWTGPDALSSFVQVPIGTPASPRGVLLVAKSQPDSLGSAAWQVWMHVAAAGLLPHVRHAQVEQMAGLLKAMDTTQDPVALISVLLRSAARFMRRATSTSMCVRLALLQPDEPPRALLFEAPGAEMAPPLTVPLSGSSGGALVKESDETGDVVASSLDLQNTLLASAISQQQARCISDCGAYMQTCPKPARDVFAGQSDLVASIVVVPLIGGPSGAALGGIYFAPNVKCEWGNMQDTLLGFIYGVTPLLHQRLDGRAGELSYMVDIAKRQASLSRTWASTPLPHLPAGPLQRTITNEGSSTISDSGEDNRPTPSGRLPKLGQSRLNTDAMLQVLQQDIRTKNRRSSSLTAPELSVGELLGRGGYGCVFKASWHKVQVAAKIMPSRASEREAMQDAVEMAVLSSVQHPNIVTVYSCLTDMAEITDNGSHTNHSLSSSVSGSLRTRYRRLRPDEDPDGEVQTFNVVVMEYCDHGTLRDAVRAGMLHRQLPTGAIGVDLASVVEILLDVAYAVQYLHSMQLVHGDIKLENILLKTDTSRSLGVTPKLSDFGLTKILSDKDHAINLEGAGTVTHLAPEMFVKGSKVTTAVDSYAFGIFMWEVYTSKRAYSGMPREAVIERVYRSNMRPRFPSSAPATYAALAEACWAASPAQRPTFGEIAERLEAISADLMAPAQAAATGDLMRLSA